MLRVALVVPDGFATLSFAPLAAFEAANHRSPGPVNVEIVDYH
jgi:hypothetical protein